MALGLAHIVPTVALAIGIGAPPQPRGGVVNGTPAALEGIEIVDRRGADLPGELTFTDQGGKPVRLGDYFDGKRPTLLVLGYYQCPMLCSAVLNGVVDGMKGVEFTAGRDYHVVVVSFDPRDTVEIAAAKRKTYMEALGRDPGARGWDFLIGDPVAVRTLAETVGFPYRWDERTEQFAHAAGIFLITPKGRLSQTLMGIQFNPRDLNFALMEASDGRLGSTWQKLVLRCFHYDPNAGTYVIVAYQVFKYGGAVILAAVLLMLSYFWRMERRRRRARSQGPAADGDRSKMEPANVRT